MGRFALIGIFFVSAASQGASSAIKLLPERVGQGQVALLRLDPSVAKDVAVRAGDQAVTLWECGPKAGGRCGLLAVPLDTPVGKMEFTVGTEKLSIGVKKGKFRVNHLTVDPSLTNPSEEEKKRIEQDKKDFEEAYSKPEKAALWDGPFLLPTKGGVTSHFGNQRMYNGEVKSTHFGVDLRADTTTPIHATNAGKVLLARGFFMAGNLVLLDHGMGVYSSYAHLSQIEVKQGQTVKAGDKLGMAGATGRVTGPHLHWSTKVNGVPVEPHSVRTAMNRFLSPKEKEKVAKAKRPKKD